MHIMLSRTNRGPPPTAAEPLVERGLDVSGNADLLSVTRAELMSVAPGGGTFRWLRSRCYQRPARFTELQRARRSLSQIPVARLKVGGPAATDTKSASTTVTTSALNTAQQR